MDELAVAFERRRPRLLRVAYGTLDRIVALDVVRNPEKLRHVELPG